MAPFREYVAASYVPALFDQHRYMTKAMLWGYIAKGIRASDPDTETMRAGKMLEPVILQMAAHDMAAEVTHAPQGRDDFVQHASLPTGCLIDGLVDHPSHGPGIISAKNVASLAFRDRWTSQEHGVPVDVEMQLQTEIEVWRSQGRDIRWGCVAAFVGGFDLHLFTRQIEAGWAEQLADALTRFYDSIDRDQPPPLMYVPEELPLVRQLWPAKPPETIANFADNSDEQERIHDLICAYIGAQDNRRVAKRMEDDLKVQLIEAAEGAPLILVPGARLKISRSKIAPLTVECPECKTEIQVREGFESLRLHGKEL